ncbi:MAG: hypothetical protein PHP86_10250 [Nevskiales bacterium]|nr:hypothetical protein [Nevskiales bacterium]
MAQPRAGTGRSRQTRLARFAQVGFWFFLIKGLLWIIVPTLTVWCGVQIN